MLRTLPVAVAATVLVVATDALASVAVPLDFLALTRTASVIVSGRVVDVQAQWLDGRRRIETRVTIEVFEYLKGDLGPGIVIRVPGGQIGRYRSRVAGAPVFEENEPVVLFLDAHPPALPWVVGLSQGVFRVVRDSASDPGVVVPPPLLATRGEPRRVQRGDPDRRPPSFEEFAAQVRRIVAGGDYEKSQTRVNLPPIGVPAESTAAPTRARQIPAITGGGRAARPRWAAFPVRYFVTDRGAAGVSADRMREAILQAFSAWQAASTARVSARFVGFTPASPFEDDGMSTLGFGDRPELGGVLAATESLVDLISGEIIESDVSFNSSVPWSTAASGEPGKYDLESVALHEIGHMLGLGHSALGGTELRHDGGRAVVATESIMFPFAWSPGVVSGRTLRPDDVAGISELYLANGHSHATGAIEGRVILDGRGVVGAHVVALNPETHQRVASFTADDTGAFRIPGLEPGIYTVRAEPVDDAGVGTYLEGLQRLDLAFGTAVVEHVVVAPRSERVTTVELGVPIVSGDRKSAPLAQAPLGGPTILEFEPSADHDATAPDGRPVVESYAVEVYRVAAVQATLVVNLGKPSPDPDGRIRVQLAGVFSGGPPPDGALEIRVTAVGPTGIGRSEPSNSFAFSGAAVRRLAGWTPGP